MLRELTSLDQAIKSANAVLSIAESSGMEVSEARLEQDQARDELTKARVTIHSFQTDLVEQDIQAGLQIASKDSGRGKSCLGRAQPPTNGVVIVSGCHLHRSW